MCNFAKWIVGGHVPMISGKPITTSTLHLVGLLKFIGNMANKMDYDRFVSKANLKHGYGRYDYQNSVYVSYTEKLNIKCNVCGETFPQTPREHLAGCGCPSCGKEKVRTSKLGITRVDMKKVIFGCAVCDSTVAVGRTKCYQKWHGILQRCFDVAFQEKEPTYKGCSICNEWLLFSSFKEWYDNHYIEGFEIDKDLLSNNLRKLYSPDTCVFLPREINHILRRSHKKQENGLPYGVFLVDNTIIAKQGNVYLGAFSTVEEAYKAYLNSKKKRITELANKWKDKIEKRAYDALINLDVDKFFK